MLNKEKNVPKYLNYFSENIIAGNKVK